MHDGRSEEGTTYKPRFLMLTLAAMEIFFIKNGRRLRRTPIKITVPEFLFEPQLLN